MTGALNSLPPPNRRAPDLTRIKSNVRKMVDMGAPEADIDQYIAEEGVSLEDVKTFRDEAGSVTLDIDGRRVQVSRNFLDLPRDQQDATVDEIAASMRGGTPAGKESPTKLDDIRSKYPGAYDDMSDDQLADALYRKHYSDMPRADFDAKIGLVSPTAAQRELARRELERRRSGTGVGAGSISAPEARTGYDMARSFGTGVRQGVEGLAGLPGDVRDMMGSGASWLAGKFGASEQNQDRFRRGAELFAPFGAGINQAATTQDVQGVTSAAVGRHYEPQTTAGEYARTTGQFATGAAAGPGGLARKTAMAVVPAAASETAGQLTKGTTAEPYARLGGALVGGGLAAGRSPNAVKELAKAAPTREALKAQTDELYGLMRESGIRYDPDQYGQMVLKAAADIRKQGFRPSTADQAFKLMDDLATDIGKAPDFDDINGLVQQTGAAARAAAAKGDGTTAKALGIIRDHLDDFEASAVMTSDQPIPKDIFNGLRKSARETALRNIKARTLDEILAKADTYAAGQEAGIRNGINNLLRSKRGIQMFRGDERKALLEVAQGRKALRTLSRFGLDLERISGNASFLPTLGAGIAYGAGGGIPAALLAAGGTAAKIASPRFTMRAFERAAGSIRAPGEVRRATMDAAKAQRLQKYTRSLLAVGSGAISANQVQSPK